MTITKDGRIAQDGFETYRVPLTPPRVLRLLHDREPTPELDHIAADFSANILA